jgi:hypothetical protein
VAHQQQPTHKLSTTYPQIPVGKFAILMRLMGVASRQQGKDRLTAVDSIRPDPQSDSAATIQQAAASDFKADLGASVSRKNSQCGKTCHTSRP